MNRTKKFRTSGGDYGGIATWNPENTTTIFGGFWTEMTVHVTLTP